MSVKELVALAKRGAQAPMNAAGNAAGTTSHLTAEMFNQAVGLKFDRPSTTAAAARRSSR